MLKFSEWTMPTLVVVLFSVFMGSVTLGQQSNEVDAVYAAHEAYHKAFGSEDMELMSKSWVHDETARLIVPPGKKVFAGWEEVKAQFEGAFEVLDIISLEAKDIQVIAGEDIAWVVDVHELEMRIDDGKVIKPEFFSTHVFHKTDGRWLMVHHQASAPPAPEE